MSNGTKIEWTQATWNPTSGCTKVSAGCDHCYIERTPPLRMAGRRFDKPGIGGTTGVVLHSERLEQPLRWRKPRRVFVNSLSDLFHDNIPDDFIAHVWAVMARTPQHTYQILTKRPTRMRSLLSNARFRRRMYDHLVSIDFEWIDANPLPWPLPNVWLGVSVEDQTWADRRIPALLHTPAAIRFLSCEPLLGPVKLSADGWLMTEHESVWHQGVAAWEHQYEPGGIDWVIVGGESGPGARPMHPDWARSLRDQCAGAGVPFFFKQWGEWRPPIDGDESGTPYARVGKKAAGRELDGRTWDEYPQASMEAAK